MMDTGGEVRPVRLLGAQWVASLFNVTPKAVHYWRMEYPTLFPAPRAVILRPVGAGQRDIPGWSADQEHSIRAWHRRRSTVPPEVDTVELASNAMVAGWLSVMPATVAGWARGGVIPGADYLVKTSRGDEPGWLMEREHELVKWMQARRAAL